MSEIEYHNYVHHLKMKVVVFLLPLNKPFISTDRSSSTESATLSLHVSTIAQNEQTNTDCRRTFYIFCTFLGHHSFPYVQL